MIKLNRGCSYTSIVYGSKLYNYVIINNSLLNLGDPEMIKMNPDETLRVIILYLDEFVHERNEFGEFLADFLWVFEEKIINQKLIKKLLLFFV